MPGARVNASSSYTYGYFIFRPGEHKVKQYERRKEPDACTDTEGCIRLATKEMQRDFLFRNYFLEFCFLSEKKIYSFYLN